jgi:hypothetical protein
MKVFDNREGFLGLLNRGAELRIYSYLTPGPSPKERGVGVVQLSDFVQLSEKEREEKLVEQVLLEAGVLAQTKSLEINGVKDNQSLTFGESGLVVYSSEQIPDELNIQLWVIESDTDIREFALDADQVLDSAAFKGLFAAVEVALAVTNPIVSGAIAVGGVVTDLLRRKLRANKDDLVGYWQTSLNRAEHYPHGVRDKQDVYDTTGNILVDYTLFGYENAV